MRLARVGSPGGEVAEKNGDRPLIAEERAGALSACTGAGSASSFCSAIGESAAGGVDSTVKAVFSFFGLSACNSNKISTAQFKKRDEKITYSSQASERKGHSEHIRVCRVVVLSACWLCGDRLALLHALFSQQAKLSLKLLRGGHAGG